jgi:hypothetical protein
MEAPTAMLTPLRKSLREMARSEPGTHFVVAFVGTESRLSLMMFPSADRCVRRDASRAQEMAARQVPIFRTMLESFEDF